MHRTLIGHKDLGCAPVIKSWVNMVRQQCFLEITLASMCHSFFGGDDVALGHFTKNVNFVGLNMEGNADYRPSLQHG